LEGVAGAYRLRADPTTAVDVPATVQGVLAARIDRLESEDKQLLQTAAVVGKDIPFELLRAVAELSPDALDRGLSMLQGAEFIYETRLLPEREYTFKHALTHEVAYGSLLSERRRPLHARIAEAMERLYGERVAEHPERLAHHFTEAGQADKAIAYWLEAGRRALERSVDAEAAADFEKGLSLINTVSPSPERALQELDLQLGLGVPLQAIKGVAAPEIGRVYSRARELAAEAGDGARSYAATWGLWKFERSVGALLQARDLARELLDLGEEQGDEDLVLQGHHSQWTTQLYLGDMVSALHHCDQAIALYRSDRHHRQTYLYGGHDPGVCAMAVSATALWVLGFPDKGLERMRKGVDLARRLGHVGTIANSYYQFSQIHLMRGDLSELAELTDQVAEVAREQGLEGDLVITEFMEGWLMAQHGQEADGISRMRDALARRRAKGRQIEETWFLALLIDALGRSGAIDEALEVLESAMADIESTEMRYGEAELNRLTGELLLKRHPPDAEAAEASFEAALLSARSSQARSFELRAATSLARLWERQGKPEEARLLLAPIYGWFTEGFETTDLKEAKSMLEQLA
jgi:predicted ATPase